MKKKNGFLISLRTTFIVSLLVGIGLPAYMYLEHPMGWKKLMLIGGIGFAGYWVISFLGLGILALATRRSKGRRSL
jgi:hypothetical protein